MEDRKCIDNDQFFTCTCFDGYEGTLCDIDADECRSHPCIHGNCTDHVNSFSCSCDIGYGGATCETDLDECSSNPCVYGYCTQEGFGAFICTCNSGFSGPLCDVSEILGMHHSHILLFILTQV